MATSLLLLLSLVRPLTAGDESTLQLVQILFRHGDRTPSHSFPTDPYRYRWTEGVEMLTPLGEEQQFQLGRFLRQRYRHFLPDRYHYNDTRVRSTDNDRAILSALSQIQGLYPGPGAGPLPQLVPVHTVPKAQDQLLKMTSPCPAYARLWAAMQRSELWRSLEEKYRGFFADLARFTGLEHVGLLRAFQLADPVNVWISHNLTLPGWASPEVVRRLFEVQNLKQWLRYYSPAMQRLRGGPLVARLTENMQGKLHGSALQRRRRWFAFSAHDSTVAAVASYLGVFNRVQPPYCACLIVELHSGDGRQFVRLFYRNGTGREPWQLKVPGCEVDCPLDTFVRLTQGNLPDNISQECFHTEEDALMSAHWSLLFRVQEWSMIVYFVTAGVVLILLFVFCKAFFRRGRVDVQ